MFRFNPRSRCNRSSRCCYRAREHVDPACSRRIRHGGDSHPEPSSSPGSVGLARPHPLTKTQAMKPSRQTWSSYGPPYPLGRWSSEHGQGHPYLHDASANKNVHVSNASRHRRCWLLLFLLLFYFFELYSRQRGRLRQLRAPSLLDSSGLALLLLPPAPRQAGRDCSALCVLFLYSLLCALVCGR